MSQSPPSSAVPENPNDASTPPSRRRYTEDFKQDVVRLIADEGYSIPAAAKGAAPVSTAFVLSALPHVQHWHSKFAPAPQPVGNDATVAEFKA